MMRQFETDEHGAVWINSDHVIAVHEHACGSRENVTQSVVHTVAGNYFVVLGMPDNIVDDLTGGFRL